MPQSYYSVVGYSGKLGYHFHLRKKSATYVALAAAMPSALALPRIVITFFLLLQTSAIIILVE